MYRKNEVRPVRPKTAVAWESHSGVQQKFRTYLQRFRSVFVFSSQINGHRLPDEVYPEFVSTIRGILTRDVGNDEQVIVGTTTQESEHMVDLERLPTEQLLSVPSDIGSSGTDLETIPDVAAVTAESSAVNIVPTAPAEKPPEEAPPESKTTYPPCIWVIGGPGSNKFNLCQRLVEDYPGWVHISVGQSLRGLFEEYQQTSATFAHDPELISIANSLSLRGEFVPRQLLMEVLSAKIVSLVGEARGCVIDGFPRDIIQSQMFENQFHQEPPVILVDCSEKTLRTNVEKRSKESTRPDDTAAALRRRIDLYRELTLPLLRALDEDRRLMIVDGDSEPDGVQHDFGEAMRRLIKQLDQFTSESTLNGDSTASLPTLATPGKGSTTSATPNSRSQSALKRNQSNPSLVNHSNASLQKTNSATDIQPAAPVKPSIPNGVLVHHREHSVISTASRSDTAGTDIRRRRMVHPHAVMTPPESARTIREMYKEIEEYQPSTSRH